MDGKNIVGIFLFSGLQYWRLKIELRLTQID